MKRLLLLIPFVFLGCKTVPIVIDTNQTDEIATETIVKGKDLESTISDIKAITDDAKQSGSINTQNTIKIIEYVDTASDQVKDLNRKILDLEKSRKIDNAVFGKTIGTLSSKIETLENNISTRNKIILALSIPLAIILLCVIIRLKLPP